MTHPNPDAPEGAKPKKATRAVKNAKAAKAAKAPPPTKADEIVDALKAASRDKEIDFERLVAALEEAIATAARKVYKVREMAARFDPKSGELTAWTPYRIVEQKTKPEVPEAPAAVDPDDIPLGQAPVSVAAAPSVIDPEKEIRLPYVELLPEEVPALLQGELSGKSWAIVRVEDDKETAIAPDDA
ncbi:MAG TPA: NusA N-terminal domain-containing protein, partial [Thermoanaerobaculia bacterium]|nr:NusA N-terminal domain-containing protein [Thermoanaerobaculia bacterium]